MVCTYNGWVDVRRKVKSSRLFQRLTHPNIQSRLQKWILFWKERRKPWAKIARCVFAWRMAVEMKKSPASDRLSCPKRYSTVGWRHAIEANCCQLKLIGCFERKPGVLGRGMSLIGTDFRHLCKSMGKTKTGCFECVWNQTLVDKKTEGREGIGKKSQSWSNWKEKKVKGKVEAWKSGEISHVAIKRSRIDDAGNGCLAVVESFRSFQVDITHLNVLWGRTITHTHTHLKHNCALTHCAFKSN